MTNMERQEQEIKTIKKRTFEVSLSDNDIRKLYELAGGASITPEELIKNFVGDLVDGTYSNGSDERMYARQWYDRCGFAHTNESFLSYLISVNMVNVIFKYDQWLSSAKADLEEIKREVEPDVSIIEDILSDITNLEKTITEEFDSFLEECNCTLLLEDEMKKVREWYTIYQAKLGA